MENHAGLGIGIGRDDLRQGDENQVENGNKRVANDRDRKLEADTPRKSTPPGGKAVHHRPPVTIIIK